MSYFEEYSPFFIIGFQRSGTTKLAEMLNAHPDLAIPPESGILKFFLPLMPLYKNLDSKKNRKRLIRDILKIDLIYYQWKYIPSENEIEKGLRENSLRGVMDSLYRLWAEHERGGSRYWGDKLPSNIYRCKEILSLFPNAKFIHLVRDGRDIGISLNKTSFGERGVIRQARAWAKAVKTAYEAEQYIGRNQFLAIRFEDFLENPEKIVRNITDFLEVPFSTAILQHTTNSYRKLKNLNNILVNKPLIKDNHGKWKSKMPPYIINLFESVAYHELKSFGYQLSNSSDISKKSNKKLLTRLWYWIEGFFPYFQIVNIPILCQKYQWKIRRSFWQLKLTLSHKKR